MEDDVFKFNCKSKKNKTYIFGNSSIKKAVVYFFVITRRSTFGRVDIHIHNYYLIGIELIILEVGNALRE
jgi:hypothetical protein